MSSKRTTESVQAQQEDLSARILSLLKEKEKERPVHKVALQFPEGLKRKAHGISEALRKAGYEIVISGEPCWGACDLDLDLMKNSNILIHIGHAG